MTYPDSLRLERHREVWTRIRILALSLTAGCGHPGPVVPVDFTADWQPFRWATVTVGSVTMPHAAVIVQPTDPRLAGPVTTEPTRLQLDFGFSSTASFGLPLRLLDTVPTRPDDRGRVVAGRIARLGVRDDSIGTTKAYRLGTVGLLYYALSGLLIDQAGQRLGAPAAGRSLPADLERRMQWSDATEDVGRLSLPLNTGGTSLGRVWFDPGSSLVPLLLTGEAWRAATGRHGDEPDLERLAFPTTGDSLILIGASPREPLSLGAIILDGLVFYAAAGPAEARPERFPPGMVGLVGSAAFDRYRLIYVAPKVRRLGVLR